MINWFKRRKALKQAREYLAGARKMLRMHSDIIDERHHTEVVAACDKLAAAIAARDTAALDGAMAKVDQLLGKAMPKPKHASVRENVEVLLVAVIVAMGVRTFFAQPFKIPTGSMQPTLYGIYPPEPGLEPYPGEEPSLVAKLFGIALEGKIYKPDGFRMRGDHIFVDRFTYHFRRPERGEVIVFETDEITELPEASRGKFYIKRLIGLPGDKIEIDPPHVKINGAILDSRPAFQRLYSMKDGYHGYELPESYFAKYINARKPTYEVPANHLFVLGDNTRSSLDGRFWGSLPQRALVGRAVFVYWPFSKRFGLIN